MTNSVKTNQRSNASPGASSSTSKYNPRPDCSKSHHRAEVFRSAEDLFPPAFSFSCFNCLHNCTERVTFSVILVIFVHFLFQASVSVHWGQNVARREPRFEFHYPLLSFIVNVGYSLCFYRHCWDFDIYITKWTIFKLLPSSHQDFGIYKWSRSLTSLFAKLRSSTLPHRHNQNHHNYCHFLHQQKESHPGRGA